MSPSLPSITQLAVASDGGILLILHTTPVPFYEITRLSLFAFQQYIQVSHS